MSRFDQGHDYDEIASTASLGSTSFQDVSFLTMFGLTSPAVVLAYFSTSPFFDINSNNYLLKTQGVEQLPQHLYEMPGLEYLVDEALSKPPNLFVIVKQWRRQADPKSPVDILEYFYCLNGTIYRCPELYQLLRTRCEKLNTALLKAFRLLMKEIDEPNTSLNTEDAEGSVKKYIVQSDPINEMEIS